MKMKFLFVSLISVVVVTAAWALFINEDSVTGDSYQFSEITIGDLESIISSTGTLSPLMTVEIGTQVSGTIDSVFVDYNDAVTVGEILAVLDTVLLKASVIDAQANLDRSEAAYEEAEYTYNIKKRLYDKGLISESEIFPFIIDLKIQKATVLSAEAQLERSRQNLDYAIIRSPISGTVISKNIESGQTVAASLSTPTLFEIAEDLSRMEILVDVDESDIGQISSGQEVRFEVQSYNNTEFGGIVRQVRLQPTTISNVVTYTAVVDAANPDNLLLPGMTATVDFIVEAKESVLLVSNKALRFKPDESVIKTYFEAKRKNRPDTDNSRERSNNASNITGPDMIASANFAVERVNRNGQQPDNGGMVWYLDENDELQMSPLRTGLTDGLNTEIVKSPALAEGTKVIIGFDDNDSKTESSSSQRIQRGGGFRPPPGF